MSRFSLFWEKHGTFIISALLLGNVISSAVNHVSEVRLHEQRVEMLLESIRACQGTP